MSEGEGGRRRRQKKKKKGGGGHFFFHDHLFFCVSVLTAFAGSLPPRRHRRWNFGKVMTRGRGGWGSLKDSPTTNTTPLFPPPPSCGRFFLVPGKKLENLERRLELLGV